MAGGTALPLHAKTGTPVGKVGVIGQDCPLQLFAQTEGELGYPMLQIEYPRLPANRRKAWLCERKQARMVSMRACKITGSPGRIRTYNPPVNSRMLCR